MKYINRILVQKACKYKTYSGFTLAEVLVTLAIIGIVAALAIPSLITNIQDQQLKTAFKKNYTAIAQATISMVEDKGGSLKGVFVGEPGAAPMMTEYGKYLNYIQKADWTSLSTCWQKSNINFLNGSIHVITGINKSCATLSNGAMLAFEINNPACTGTTRCGDMWIDVNGLKGPNTWGKDVFGINTYENGVRAFGIDDGVSYIDHCAGTQGIGCAGAVLLNINY